MLLGPVWRDDEQLVDLPVRQLVVRVLLHTLREPTGGRCNTSRKEKQCFDPDPGGKKAKKMCGSLGEYRARKRKVRILYST